MGKEGEVKEVNDSSLFAFAIWVLISVSQVHMQSHSLSSCSHKGMAPCFLGIRQQHFSRESNIIHSRSIPHFKKCIRQ
jgi:hypothetical protein